MQSALTSSYPASCTRRYASPEQVERVRALKALVARREQGSDVAQPGRTENGVGQRMSDDIAVGMACEAATVIQPNASQNEWSPLLERMRVHAQADPQLAHGSILTLSPG